MRSGPREVTHNRKVNEESIILQLQDMVSKHLCTDQLKKREGGEVQLGRSNISASDQLATPLIPLFPP